MDELDHGTFLTQGSGEVLDFNDETTQLQRKKQEKKEVDEQLARAKLETADAVAKVEQGEAEFKRKQEQFYNQIQQFQKFIQDSDKKRNSQLRMADSERRERLDKEKETAEKEKQLADLEEQMQRYKEEHEELNRYQEFLAETVKQNHNEFTYVDELLNRHRMLHETYEQLVKEHEAKQKELEALSESWGELSGDAENKILVLNSQLAASMKQLEERTSATRRLEEGVHSTHLRTQGNDRVCCQVKQGITNIYDLSYQSFPFKKPRYLKPDAEEGSDGKSGTKAAYLMRLLSEVGQRIRDLKSIHAEWSKSGSK